MTDRYFIPEKYRFLGEWWEPHEISRKIAGELTWDEERAELDLHGAFKINVDFTKSHVTRYPAIHGYSRDGAQITILDGSTARRSMNPNSGPRLGYHEAIRFRTVAIGTHIDKTAAFVSARFLVPGLEIWSASECIGRAKVVRNEAGGRDFVYTVFDVPDEPVRIDAIASTVTFKHENEFDQESWMLNVGTKAYVRIDSDNPQPISWFLTQIRRITEFIGLLGGCGFTPTGIQVNGIEAKAKVDVLVSFNTPYDLPHSSPHQFFILRDKLGKSFGSLLANWMNMPAQLTKASELALSILNSNNLWPHVEFLSLMQALEGFHRGLDDVKYMDEGLYHQVYDAMVRSIPDALGADHRSSMKSRIKYGNEISLRTRLKRLIERVPVDLRNWILGPSGKIPNAWVDTRNYFTHWDEESKDNVLDDRSLIYAHARMRMLVRVLYLLAVGVHTATIMDALQSGSLASRKLVWALNNDDLESKI